MCHHYVTDCRSEYQICSEKNTTLLAPSWMSHCLVVMVGSDRAMAAVYGKVEEFHLTKQDGTIHEQL